MKVKILKKTIKEGITSSGAEYCIKSLFVSFTEEEIYNKIVAHLKALTAPDEKIEKFIKPNIYNNQISYAFWLSCSHFTFDAVERFGTLDVKIVFTYNDKGFCGAKIKIEDRKEQVLSYEPAEEVVSGWACGNPEPRKTEDAPIQVVPDLSDMGKLPEQFTATIPEDNGLPF
jgi:hypothetical protein